VQTSWLKGVTVVLLLAFIHLTIIPVGVAQSAGTPSSEEQGTAKGAGLQAASWLLTIPYGAVKVAFAIVGGVTGGLTYAFSGGNLDAAKSVWQTSMYGTYVITPDHLKGDQPIRFLGVPAEGENEPAPVK
jgi:hypothetical protein